MTLGRLGRVGRMIVGRAGRLVVAVLLALAVTLAPVTSLAMPPSARACELKPTRVGWRCFCRGMYGWTTAPAFMCRVR